MDIFQISPSLAKMLLHMLKWQPEDIIYRYHQNPEKLLVDCCILPAIKPVETRVMARSMTCPVCLQYCDMQVMYNLACGHKFCRDCWQMHFQVQILAGTTTSTFFNYILSSHIVINKY